jgi:hypothetical protein
MKNTICKLLLIVNLFPFAALGQSNTEAQIKRVERGLLPARSSDYGAESICGDVDSF